jgi:hypothetical protein
MTVAAQLEGFCIACGRDTAIRADGRCLADGRFTIPPSYGKKGERLVDGRWQAPSATAATPSPVAVETLEARWRRLGCGDCERTEAAHYARGLCGRCYKRRTRRPTPVKPARETIAERFAREGCVGCGRTDVAHHASMRCRRCHRLWKSPTGLRACRECGEGFPAMRSTRTICSRRCACRYASRVRAERYGGIWSPAHAACVRCGGSDRPHWARGHCRACYMAWWREQKRTEVAS